MAKKILGISFGRKMSNCDIMVKHALMQCEKAGYEVSFIRADDLNISNCTGCIACVIQIMMGKGRGYCVRHDDFDILDECVMQSDALILACPTYETSVTGRFKTICDRIGPSHDITFRKAAYEEGSGGKAGVGASRCTHIQKAYSCADLSGRGDDRKLDRSYPSDDV